MAMRRFGRLRAERGPNGWGTDMGEVIRFPDDAGANRGGKYVDAATEPATVIILPVVRIERGPDGSSGAEPPSGSGRRRRRRAVP